ncbi:copper amine oxidase N-terminal domain-containing protein [Paenibacillus radicis (ex Xue et al. 2023)]|uniref:Copper amine oxidase N-terminal domain-containing protein n=1 Tax=Paenibacillus radicis (ex Xue et al. 2023) TaxID=2972489 RepID=A0ABT1YGW7_9BACL|nr:copper amine oxidase N-terminal domain-containing protein [Paenibacillus radicis (ex Xue et al. 2023)]MCR8632421.1 copper amine oxidase N-terminal domain-containing protein [Paenibacillus radicis (ex Xue et al. 2023)]
MFRKMKLWCASTMLLLGAVSPVYAEQTPTPIDVYYAPLQFVIDNDVFAPHADQKGFIYEGSTYVPLRFISYSLKKAVRWDGDTYTVTVEEPSTTDLVSINDYNVNTKVHGAVSSQPADTSSLNSTQIAAYKEKVSYIFDGKSKEIGADLPGFIYEGSLYVPLRFFSESVGKKIEWDAKTYTVSAKTQEAPKTEPEPVKPSETTVTTPVVTGGGGSGGGGGGGSSSGGSSKSAAEVQLEGKLRALENSCRADLQVIVNKYDSKAIDGKTAVEEVKNISAGCNKQFDAIISEGVSLKISDSVLKSYQSQFEQMQTDSYMALLKKYGK